MASSTVDMPQSSERELRMSRQTPEIGSNATGEEAHAESERVIAKFKSFSSVGGVEDAPAASKDEGPPPAFPRLPYRPEVDGLRAIAIIPVVLFHFECGFQGGFAGVDVFFVISGFLITCIVLHELAKEKFSMKDFWFRRVRRLFPALVLMLVPLFAAGWHLFVGSTYTSMMEAVTLTLAMGANILYYSRADDYFAADHTEEPLLHCWSLAVEEQFYLVHPVMLLLLWRCTKSTKAVLAGLVILAGASFVVSIAYSKTNAMFAYYMLPARAWEMAIGGILAFDHGRSIFDDRLVLAEIVSWSGVAMIIASCFVFTAATPWPSFYALLPCLGTVFFIWANRPSLTWGGKLFAHKVPVFVGQLSYSWYLWHWPVYVLIAYTSLTGHLRPGEKVAGLLGSFATAVLSFKYVEPVFRKKDNRWASNTLFAGVVAVVWIIMISYSTVAWQLEAGGIRYDMTQSAPPPLFTAHLVAADAGSGGAATAASCWDDVPLLDVDYTVLDKQSLMTSRTWGPDFLKYTAMLEPTATPSIVVIGSSIAGSYGPMIERLAAEYQKPIAFMVQNGVGGMFGLPEAAAEAAATEHSKLKGRHGYDGFMKFVHHPEWDSTRLARLEEWKPELVVWADAWGGQADVAAAQMQATMQHSLELIAKHTGGARIVIIGGLPNVPGNFGDGVGIFNSLQKMIVNVDRKYNGQFGTLQFLRELTPGRRLRVEEDIMIAIEKAAKDSAGNNISLNVSLEPIAQYFLRENATEYVKLIDPYTLQMAYLDQVHLNADGVRVLEGLFRKSIFGVPSCNNANAGTVGGAGGAGEADE